MVNDPAVSTTANGKTMAKFAIAVQRDYKNPTTDKYDADFFDCIVWGKQAEYVGKYYRRGQLVAIEGKFETRDYEAADGSKRRAYQMIISHIESLGKRESTGGGDAGKKSAPKQQEQGNVSHAASVDDDFTTLNPDDDIPF
jgi:single-strand DNA-binding protein